MKPIRPKADRPHTPERDAQFRDPVLRLRFSPSFVLPAVRAIAEYVAFAAALTPFGRNFSVPCSGTYAGAVADKGAELGVEADAGELAELGSKAGAEAGYAVEAGCAEAAFAAGVGRRRRR